MLPHDCFNNFFSVQLTGNITLCLLCGKKYKHSITYVCGTCYITGRRQCEHKTEQRLRIEKRDEIYIDCSGPAPTCADATCASAGPLS
jgi:hypothetical protein